MSDIFTVCPGPGATPTTIDGKPVWHCHGEACKVGDYRVCKERNDERGYVTVLTAQHVAAVATRAAQAQARAQKENSSPVTTTDRKP